MEKKNALILGKNALIVVICGLNFSFKIKFLRLSRRKNRRFFSAGPFSCCKWFFMKVPALIPIKLSCPKKSWLRAWSWHWQLPSCIERSRWIRISHENKTFHIHLFEIYENLSIIACKYLTIHWYFFIR